MAVGAADSKPDAESAPLLLAKGAANFGQSAQESPGKDPKALGITVAAVAVWYASNIGLVLLNKYLLTDFGFRQPVGLTLWHMVACSIMTFGLGLTRAFEVQHITSRRQLAKVSLLATIFCISVVFGNIALKYIPISFTEAIFATTPFFTAFFALLAGTRESQKTYLALIPIVVGIVMATGFEPSFHMVGFAAAVAATASRGFKAVLQGILLSSSTERLDSLNLLRYMAPIATVVLLVMVGAIEPDLRAALPQLDDPAAPRFYAVLGFNGFLAFFTNLCNFLIVKYTSALTLQVIGALKGVLAVVLSIMLFHNMWNFSSMTGYGVCVAGAFMYMQAKRAHSAELAAARALEATKLDRSSPAD